MVADVAYLQQNQQQIEALEPLLAAQRAAYRANPMPSAEQRRAWLKALRELILGEKQALIEAVSRDFSNRAASSPAIFNRSYSTSLSLKDGSAILIAGLMSQRQTDGDSGVPFLKDVPVLGNLFKSQKQKRDKTELVLMIVPYIVETDTEAEELTRSLRQRFELIDLSLPGPSPTTQVMPSTPVSQPAPQR